MSNTPTYKAFIFKSYNFDVTAKTLKLSYGFDDAYSFTEEYRFNFDLRPYDQQVLDRAIQSLFFMAGVSYYKAFPVEAIRIDQGKIDRKDADFFAKTYQRGLGEYYYINKMNPRTEVPFIANTTDQLAIHHNHGTGAVIGIGGGKDSLVSAELLRSQPDIATWSLGHRSQLEPLIKRIGLPHFWVERTLDPQIIGLSAKGALGGHIPISAIFGCVGSIVAILSGHRDSIVSNENSSNEPTLQYDGVAINHQYSKSLEYEKDYQAYLARHFDDTVRYYSFLRPFSEVKIAELFAELGFEKYKDVFSSCNRAFVQGSNRISWCGQCSKCAFTFLALSPFIPHTELEKLWHKNLLLDPTLVTTYQNLLGISGDKPLDCVGEIKESRAAMQIAQKDYPGLSYEFDIPADYSYKNLADHSKPPEMYAVLTDYLNSHPS